MENRGLVHAGGGNAGPRILNGYHASCAVKPLMIDMVQIWYLHICGYHVVEQMGSRMCLNKPVYVHCNVPLYNMSCYPCAFQVQHAMHRMLKPKLCFFDPVETAIKNEGCCMGTKGV